MKKDALRRDVDNKTGQHISGIPKNISGFLFLLFFVPFFFACGDSNPPKSTEGGTVDFGVRIQGQAAPRVGERVDLSSGEACAAADIETISVQIVDESHHVIASGGPWPCTQDGGVIENVPAGGGRRVVVLCQNKTGNIVLRGESLPITVVENETTDAGMIDTRRFIPSFPNRPNDFTIETETFEFSWDSIDGAAGYRFVVSPAEDFSEPILDQTGTDTSVSTHLPSRCGPYYYQLSVVDSSGNQGKSQPLMVYVREPGKELDPDDWECDGAPNKMDNCPRIYNPEQTDSDQDGVGDECDQCPSDAAKTEPGVCGCGKPETDTDGDGLPNCDGMPNHPPTIQGSPATSVAQNTTYDFTPTAADPDGDTLTFSIIHCPLWAKFEKSTGTLSGTPGSADIGTTANIVIRVSDGTAFAELKPFNLSVVSLQYHVVFTAGPNGTIVGENSQTIPYGGDCRAVSVVPDEGFSFSGWSGDFTGVSNPLTITHVTRDMNITANFSEAVLHVDPIHGNAANDGGSWDRALPTLQDALRHASPGKEIWMKEGGYTLNTTIIINIPLAIYGGFPAAVSAPAWDQRNARAYPTSIVGNNALSCFEITADTILDGLFIGNGRNSQYGGAGIYAHGNSIENRINLTLTGCIFDNNLAEAPGGGAILNQNCNFVCRDASFTNNGAAWGGAVANFNGSVAVTNCIFRNNYTAQTLENGYGGALHNNHCTPVSIENSQFIHNNAGWGGGLHNNASSLSLVNCIFLSNNAVGETLAQSSGGAVYNYRGDITITNCTFFANQTNGLGGALANLDFSPQSGSFARITNTIFWANRGNEAAPEIYNQDFVDNIQIQYCVLATAAYPGEGNISADPLFVADESENVRLSDDSPCIDAGSPNAPLPTFDLDGKKRQLDGNRDGVVIVDMGAYEYSVSVEYDR